MNNKNEQYRIVFCYYEASTSTIFTEDINTAYDIIFMFLRNNLYTLDLYDPEDNCILTWNKEYGFSSDD